MGMESPEAPGRQCCLTWTRMWRIGAAVCPPAHPFLQMEPAAEAACASLLSELLWPREVLPALCREEAGFFWPA